MDNTISATDWVRKAFESLEPDQREGLRRDDVTALWLSFIGTAGGFTVGDAYAWIRVGFTRPDLAVNAKAAGISPKDCERCPTAILGLHTGKLDEALVYATIDAVSKSVA